MDKIGVFGGTFNPIHKGHLNMAKQIGNRLGLDCILIIPAYVPPHKEENTIAAAEHRFEMCCLACEDDPLFQVCDVEVKRRGRSYTLDTLNEISNRYNKSKLYYIMGTDSFLSIMSWNGFKEIIKLAILCTSPRNSKEIPQLLRMKELLDSKGASTRVCDISIMPVSSTEIRLRIKKGLSIEDLVQGRNS